MRGRAVAQRSTSRSASTGWSTTMSRGHARDPRRSPTTAACRLQRHGPAAAQRRAQGARPASRALARARPRARRRGPRRAAPARHVLRRPARPAEAARAGPGRRRAHRLRARRRRPRAREPVPDRAGRGPGARSARRSTPRSARSSSSTSAAGCSSGRACASTSTRSRASARSSSSRAVADAASDLRREADLVARLREVLEIADDAIEATGYADLLREGANGARPAAEDGAEELLRAAEAVMARAHVPVLALPGRRRAAHDRRQVVAAANVENAAYPQGQCAEASAIGAMIAAGGTEIAEVAVVAQRLRHLPAVRRLPPAAVGVRPAGDAGAPRPARRAAPHDRARRAAAAGVRVRGAAGVSAVEEAASALVDRAGRSPRIGIVLGSGLGAVADAVGRRRTSSATRRSPASRSRPSPATPAAR